MMGRQKSWSKFNAQSWSNLNARRHSSATVALDAALRFLLHFGAIDREFAAPQLAPLPAPQRVVEVTEAVTIASDDFRFAATYIGMEVIARAAQ